MDILLLTKQSNFYVCHYEYGNNEDGFLLFKEELIDYFEDGECYSSDAIVEILDVQELDSSHEYKCYRKEDVCCLLGDYNKGFWDFIPAIRKLKKDIFFHNALIMKDKYELKRKEDFFANVFGDGGDIRQCVKYISEYNYCSDYSFWVYNSHTDVFNLISSSFEPDVDFFKRGEGCSLFEFMASDEGVVYREPNIKNIPSRENLNHKSLTRLKLKLGSAAVGVINFYFSEEGLKVKGSQLNQFKEIIENKYASRRLDKYNNVEDIRLNISSVLHDLSDSAVHDVFQNAVIAICDSLNFECCSVFIEKNGGLFLKASKNESFTGAYNSNKPMYEFDDGSLTMTLYESDRSFDFSYNIGEDERNSHLFDEKTSLEPRNWIAIKIEVDGEKFGVLRVKNKFTERNGSKEFDNFTSSDISDLKLICLELAGVLSINDSLNDLRGSIVKARGEISRINNFNKVFLHEVRTPISRFTLTPSRIVKMIAKEDVDKNKIVNLLNDIMYMGQRLNFIVSSYNVEQMITPKDLIKVSVLKDVIFPILNISREQIKKQYGVDVLVDHYSFSGVELLSDSSLMTMVVHALLDNAAKYTDEDQLKPIRVYGSKSQDTFEIFVSSYSLKINIDEAVSIFSNGVRGKVAVDSGMHGTGIGLYLVKEILDRCGGNVELVSNYNPVVFKIEVPLYV